VQAAALAAAIEYCYVGMVRPYDSLSNEMNSLFPRLFDDLRGYVDEFNIVAPLTVGVLVVATTAAFFAIPRMIKSRLRFTTYERDTVWFGEMMSQRYVVSLKATWKATNRSRRSITLKSFYVPGLATDHHILAVRGSHGGEVVVSPKTSVDVEAFCLVNKTLTWRSGDFLADVCLVDSRDRVRTVRRVRFNEIKPSRSAGHPAQSDPVDETHSLDDYCIRGTP
jgi:hypothetical protein